MKKKYQRNDEVSFLRRVATSNFASARWATRAGGFCCLLAFGGLLGGASEEPSKSLQLTRAARPWEFLCSVGQRAGIFGNESGNIEAWVYPLKLFRDFALTFRTENRAWKADALVRSVIARPESTTLVYVSDAFRVEETFFVPVEESGAVIRIQVDTEKPLEIEASFLRDFQLEWPAALGATYASWDESLRAFTFGEEQKRYAGVIGSPSGILAAESFDTNYAHSSVSSLRLGVTAKGKDTKLIVVAGSINGAVEAANTYRKLSEHFGDLEKASAEYYANYLERTVQLDLPDADLQKAYDWSRVSALQGLVANPYLGKGLIAGYRTSGASQRPGFAWFFGRDALWTSFALNSAGDFSTARDALRFLIQFQRDDGKIPHEIAQTASLVDWFKNYPYGFASADATPLFIIAAEDYVRASGDAAFAKENWKSLWKAYQFLKSTYDESGLPKNLGVGHGWVEGGPLLPVQTELYQSGLGAEALHALAELAKVADKTEEEKSLSAEFEKQKPRVEAAFWSPEHKMYAWPPFRCGLGCSMPAARGQRSNNWRRAITRRTGACELFLAVPRSIVPKATTLVRCGHSSPVGRRSANIDTIRHIPPSKRSARTRFLRWMARQATSPRSFRALTTRGCRRVLRIRSGPLPWWSTRFCADCLASKRTRFLGPSRSRLHCRRIGLLSQCVVFAWVTPHSTSRFAARRTKCNSKLSAPAAANAFSCCSRQSACGPKLAPSN